MHNLEKMDTFLEKFNLARLNQEEIEIMSDPTTNSEIKTVIKKISILKKRFTAEFYQTFREELMPIILKLFQKTSEEGTLQNSF